MPTKKVPSIEAPATVKPHAVEDDTSPSESLPQETSRRDEQVRLAAYLAAERRGFAPGYELEDWLTAEQELNAAIGNSERGDQRERT